MMSKLLIRYIIKIIKALITYLKLKVIIVKWKLCGRPIPPPHIVKQQIIKEHAKKYKIKTFIETGTFFGQMVHAVSDIFDRIISIELDPNLYNNAQILFSDFSHISILHGDSSDVLKYILPTINEQCLFWLDGHYSEGVTAKGKLNTPIIEELNLILSHKIKNHIILIDDARCFTGKNDYPKLEKLKEYVNKYNKNCTFENRDDVIRISYQE